MAIFRNLSIRALLQKFFSDSGRSMLVKKQAIYSLTAKVFDALISFILVRVTLTYLDEYEYGLWITLSSILTWINSLDIGFDNGLKNKLGEAFAQNDMVLARKYISTTFVAMMFIAFMLFILYSLVAPWLDWNNILNVSAVIPKLNFYVCFFLIVFLFNFVFKLIGTVYMAKIITSMVQILHLAGMFLSLILIQCLIMFKQKGTFIEVGFIYCLMPLLVYLIMYPYTFYIRYPELRPSFKFFQKTMLKELLQLSWQFFFIQIAVVVFFLASNLIITQFFGPQHVTPYNIANKYYSLLYMSAWVFFSPVWSATIQAYALQDFDWIRKSFKKTIFLFLALAVIFLFMFCFSPLVFKIWVGHKVSISPMLSFVVMLQNIIMTFGALICVYINGIGKIRLQLYGYWLSVVIYPILGWWLGNLFGVVGIIGTVCIMLAALYILLTIQYFKIVSGKAAGIWMK